MRKTIYAVMIAVLTVMLTGAEGFAAAESGFFGFKMRSESYARDLLKQDNFKASVESFPEEEGIDKSVYAAARFKYTMLGGYIMEVIIFNHSKTDIPADAKFTDFIIVLKDGERERFTDPGLVWFPSTEKILAGRPLSLRVNINGRRFDKSDIEMIVCSFNLGDTKIVMVPLPDQAPVPKPYREIAEHVRPWIAGKEITERKEVVPKPYQEIVERVRPQITAKAMPPAVSPKEAGLEKPVRQEVKTEKKYTPKPYHEIVERVHPQIAAKAVFPKEAGLNKPVKQEIVLGKKYTPKPHTPKPSQEVAERVRPELAQQPQPEEEKVYYGKKSYGSAPVPKKKGLVSANFGPRQKYTGASVKAVPQAEVKAAPPKAEPKLLQRSESSQIEVVAQKAEAEPAAQMARPVLPEGAGQARGKQVPETDLAGQDTVSDQEAAVPQEDAVQPLQDKTAQLGGEVFQDNDQSTQVS